MVCGRGSGRSQLKSASGTDRVRLCGHVKLSLLNSVDYPEYPDRKVGVRACVIQALLPAGSVLVNPSIQNVRAKFIYKKYQRLKYRNKDIPNPCPSNLFILHHFVR